jgi:hypothetical protein
MFYRLAPIVLSFVAARMRKSAAKKKAASRSSKAPRR